MPKIDTLPRLTSLRELMRNKKIDVYLIPSEDSHLSGSVAPCDARRGFISGFTGSSGCAIVTADRAALATDGRYFNQAEKQLDANWLLLKQGLADSDHLSWQDWLAEQSSGGKTVGVDPALVSASEAATLLQKIKRAGGAGLVGVDENLVDIVWGASRPARPRHPIVVHPEKFSGSPVEAKLARVRAALAKRKSPVLAVSTLDDIAWLFNLRGADIPYNPVFFAYAIVTADEASLYVDEAKLTEESRRHLEANKVQIRPYDAIMDEARLLSKSLLADDSNKNDGTTTLLTEPPPKRFTVSKKVSLALQRALGGKDAVDEVRSIIGEIKAVKNEVEIAGLRACNVRDGAALVEYLAWLEDQLVAKRAVLDEVAAANKLEALRTKQEHFVGLSFPTISSTGANAAVIHYEPQPDACSIINPDAIYLCDSGAQYLDGTTDTTRTVHFGTPSAAEKRAYTLVLKGHISLDMAVFPKGTSGFALDVLARQHLRRDGLDYRHSTGHGVGSYLNVHESIIGIGQRMEWADISLQPGHVTSNEPGYYEDGAFGIRIENVMVVRQVDTPHRFGGQPFLSFDNITMVPLCRALIDVELLTAEERRWVDGYHAKIYDTLRGVFEGDALTSAWLLRETRPL